MLDFAWLRNINIIKLTIKFCQLNKIEGLNTKRSIIELNWGFKYWMASNKIQSNVQYQVQSDHACIKGTRWPILKYQLTYQPIYGPHVDWVSVDISANTWRIVSAGWVSVDKLTNTVSTDSVSAKFDDKKRESPNLFLSY